jgi:hypothetical protein
VTPRFLAQFPDYLQYSTKQFFVSISRHAATPASPIKFSSKTNEVKMARSGSRTGKALRPIGGEVKRKPSKIE